MLSPYLNSDDDWIEKVRKWLYPRLHPYLKNVGGYGVGGVYENQYVGTTQLSEDEFEEKLVVDVNEIRFDAIGAQGWNYM